MGEVKQFHKKLPKLPAGNISSSECRDLTVYLYGMICRRSNSGGEFLTIFKKEMSFVKYSDRNCRGD